MTVLRTRDVYQADPLRAAGKALLAPFRFLRWCFRGVFRVGVFFLVEVPVAAMGFIFLVCAVVVIASWVRQIYDAKVSHSTAAAVVQAPVARHGQPVAYSPGRHHRTAQNEGVQPE